MKAIMVMFDSLNRKMLEPYGCDWTITPNFKRLAEKSVRFDNCYAGSLPCMPARRELHTGRINFLHRSWGPMEPFDDSMPEILKNNGIYTHLVSDHQHYWEDGGATYHNRYSSWEISRGQEGDRWKADLKYKYSKSSVYKNKEKMFQYPNYRRKIVQDQINRMYMDTEDKTSQAVTFSYGLEFIERNYKEDNWFLQIETFDPHEPFYTMPNDKQLYPYNFAGDEQQDFDWPPYAPVEEHEEIIQHVRYDYAALVSKCDRYLGKVLDMMDLHDMWKDTMLIVNTDHGFLLGEHGWWGKTTMPCYDEISHIPLFIFDPRRKQLAGECRQALVQTIDIAPTLLEYFNLEIPPDMEGKPLKDVMDEDTPIREYALFGYHGGQINITDGRYVYMHSAKKTESRVYEYTLMPAHMRQLFQPEELQNIQIAGPFKFTKGCKVLKIEKIDKTNDTNLFGSLLFNIQKDTMQQFPIRDKKIEDSMKSHIREIMKKNDAPMELFTRYGL